MRAEWADLTASDGHKFKAWRAEPRAEAKGAIVVIQEIFGVNSHIRDVTERFAREGYVAIAPALFDRYERDFDVGYGPEDRPKAMAIVPRLDIAKAMLDTEAARAAVANAGKVGIVGFCFGGVVAWLGATRLKFAASSCYYGGRIAALKDEKLHCPVIMHFGAKDAHIPLSDVEAIRKAQPNVPIYVYDADHGFSCDDRVTFDKAAHELAWSRTMTLFHENVG